MPNDLIKAAVAEQLSLTRLGKPKFVRTVDLGCGSGEGGILIRPYTQYLVGVDVDPAAVAQAEKMGVYDKLHVGDIRTFHLESFDSVFMFEVIEHVPKQDGRALLHRCRGRFVMITTPWWSLSLLSPWRLDGHVCAWAAQEFATEGFKVWSRSFYPDIYCCLAYGGFYVAVRE